MEHRVISATADEQVSQVIERMIAVGVKKFPVLDEKGHVIEDLPIIDLMHNQAHRNPSKG